MAAVTELDPQGAGLNPAGFLRTPSRDVADVRWEHGRWMVEDESLTGLRSLRGLRVGWPRDPVDLAALADLAAAGVPLHAEETPEWAVRADPALAGLITAGDWIAQTRHGTSRCTADLRREEHSVRLRRHGLARRAAAVTPKVSVVMSSMRPHLLGSALAQIARQRRVEVEVLLALHGVPAGHEEVRRALAEFGGQVTVVEAGMATPFGEVLNQAAARASGEYVAKWDDDDWYGPEHLSDLLLARSYSGADIVGTAAEFFYLEPLNVTIRRTDYTSEVWSDHVAGGTILVDRAGFRETGGFPALPRGVDAAFLKAAHAAGARVYRTHGLGYVLRRSVGAEHTWRLPLAHFLRVASNQWRGFRPSLILEKS
ncbi:glycosyltransferase family 2 protein [Streptosporangium sp. NPDC000396]|uniref:glycosyltransferase family 2 protein n=1 Tax=Streptosporangium sp. NPDC000396 TaxID=3366185 RepID=UPI0036C8E276